MQKMMQTKFYFFLPLLFIGCNNNSKEAKVTFDSYHVSNGVQRDTINKTNERGKQGHWIIFYKDSLGNPKIGKNESSGDYVDGKKQGFWNFYNVDGTLDSTVEYKDDIPLTR